MNVSKTFTVLVFEHLCAVFLTQVKYDSSKICTPIKVSQSVTLHREVFVIKSIWNKMVHIFADQRYFDTLDSFQNNVGRKLP